MSKTPTIAVWRVSSVEPPALLRRCPRCDATRAFGTSGRFRINANGRRLDVWLIYRCERCKATLNREVHERVTPEKLSLERYQGFLRNEAWLADEVAYDVRDLGPTREGRFQVEVGAHAPRVRLAVPRPISTRLDRVLSVGLACSRARIRSAIREGRLILPRGGTELSKPVRDGLQFDVRGPLLFLEGSSALRLRSKPG